MRLKLTLVRPAGPAQDIVVTTDAAANISDIAATIARLDPHQQPAVPGSAGAPAALTLRATLPGHAESLLLPPDGAIGEAWIGSGASVTLEDAGVYYSPAGTGNAPTVAMLRLKSGPDAGREFALPVGTSVLGREDDCDIVLGDRLVSKRHVRFEVSDGVEVIDLGSANGIVVDGELIGRFRIESTAALLIGDTEVEIEVLASAASTGYVPTAGPVFFNRSPTVERRYAGEVFAAPEAPPEKDDNGFPFLALMAPMVLGIGLYIVTQRLSSLMFVALSPLLLIGNYFTNKSRDKKKLKRLLARFDERLASLVTQLGHEKIIEQQVRLAESPSTAETLEQALRRGPMLWTRRPEHWSFLNVRLGIGSMLSRNTVDAGKRGEILPELRARLDQVIADHRRVDGVPLIDNLYDSGALGIAGSPASAGGSLNAILVQLTALHSPAELVVAALVTPAWSRELEWLKWMPHTSSPQSPLAGSHLVDGAASGAVLLSQLEGLITQRLGSSGHKSTRRGAMDQQKAALDRGADVGTEATEAGTRSAIPAIVVLISDDVGLDRARLVQLAETAADAGVFPIWIAASVPELPAACRTWLHTSDATETGPGTATPGTATVGFVRLGETITDVATEYVDAATAHAYARRMAAVIDAGALVADASDLPRTVSLVTLLGHDLVESSDAVVDRWRQNASIHNRTPGAAFTARRAGKLRAIIGSSGVDAMHLDLRTQGPHALVGGTTGAGKSEFLQAWVLGMAAEYSPDRVTFLFVDYKGGSAFADCVNLPHCVGLVTDLSPHLVRRALTSLRAELHHREHLLNRKKAKDLLELEKRGDPESPPALVLVIDEFAALASEVPEFVDGVVDIAQRGRSLGIHLIMATQRPAGVIKDNLRANTPLRIALRMADESDSSDVIGTKDASHFDPGIPGRGIAKTGPGRLQQFQSSYAGGWTSREPDRPGITVAELRFGGEAPWQEPKGTIVEEVHDLGPTDQQRLVERIRGASALATIPAPRRPWLDEMAAAYDLSKLRQRTDSELLIGVSDIPQLQQQRSVYFYPDVDGHLVIYGTGGSGKSAALRTLACAAAITPRGGPVHVYGLDFGAGSLRMLDALPHVGGVISGDDTERIVRLFRMLKGVLEDRGSRFADANASNITDYRAQTGLANEPRILLLIDGFPTFRNDWEVTSGRAPWYNVFKDILSDGRQLGINVAFTADRPGAVPSSVSSNVQRRVILRLADDAGYSILDAPGDILSSKSVPGRAIVDNLETQVAVLGGSRSVSDQSAAVKQLASAMRRAGAGTAAAPAIGAMPREYPASELPAVVELAGGHAPVLGIAEDTLGPIGFDPTGVFLLAGPPASGRTTALTVLHRSLLRFDPAMRLYYIGSARSSVAALPTWAGRAVTVEEAVALAKDLAAAVSDADTEGRIGIFIESISEFLQSPADAPLVQLIKDVKRSDHFLLAEGETGSWSSSWPLMTEVKTGRRGLLLQPDSMEGDLILKTPLPRINRAEFPTGRGIYVARGKSVRVQLGLASD
ncbi:FHA domain-containing protein [Cryobacterium frigoriphilum]|uniref:FHA domain-containing protein n=1 Tax=Cryobacterium frigoriphilum TaxID=1259150 RepID=A0A4R9ABP6_9MICO|nr:FtsK/SpoIIIE domain-containing protein [Cryobacterium frigoriphilum]TFD56077.1 FHA domain-containing protein [Cryobacterium frigoriphilum]